MTDETETSDIDICAALESDLSAVRKLLREAVTMGGEKHRNADQRVSLMAAASRMLTAATGASTVLARLKGMGTETTHRTIVESSRPRGGKPPTESWSSRLDRMSPQEQAEMEAKYEALAAPFYAAAAKEREKREGDPSGENSKTTSEAVPRIR